MTEIQRIDASAGRRCTEAIVRGIPEPKFTDTWHPHGHGKVIDATALAVESLGLKIKNKSYSLSAGGMKMFGLWQIEQTNGKFNCLGFRNSMDKSMSIGYISVLTVIVCTNQITHGNYFQLRRHTSGLDVQQLGELASEAIGKVVTDLKITNDWHEGLKEISLEHRRAEQLVVRAMRTGVLAPTNFKEFDALFFGGGGVAPVYEQTLYGFHGALTQIIRDHSYGRNVILNQEITAFVNEIRAKA